MVDARATIAGSFARTPPVLETGRLLLRVHDETDLEAAAAMWGDPEVVRYIGGKPSTREEVWQRILRYRGHWTVRPFGYWAITDRTSGRYLGDIGVADWQRTSLADMPGVVEAGWALSPTAQGCGFAAEALGRLLAWTDQELRSDTICIIDDANQPSVRLAERMGYRRMAVPAGGELSPTRYLRTTGEADVQRRVGPAQVSEREEKTEVTGAVPACVISMALLTHHLG